MDGGEDCLRQENDLDAMLVEDAFRVSKLRSPSHLVTNPDSFGEKGGYGYTLYSTRGDRNLIDVLRQSDEETDRFIEQSLKFIHARAGDAIISKYPEFESALKGTLMKDAHTYPRKINLACQEKGLYDMGDISFNLMPKRSEFLKCFNIPPELAGALDEECVNGEGCYYKTRYFKHVGLPGPVCLGKDVEDLVTSFKVLAREEEMEEIITNLLYNKLVSLKIGGKNTIERQYKVCVVCLLVQQSVNQMLYDGTNKNGKGDGKDVFLINIDKGDDLGFGSFLQRDYFRDLINAHSSYVIQQGRELNFSNYVVRQEEDGKWVAFKTTMKKEEEETG